MLNPSTQQCQHHFNLQNKCIYCNREIYINTVLFKTFIIIVEALWFMYFASDFTITIDGINANDIYESYTYSSEMLYGWKITTLAIDIIGMFILMFVIIMQLCRMFIDAYTRIEHERISGHHESCKLFENESSDSKTQVASLNLNEFPESIELCNGTRINVKTPMSMSMSMSTHTPLPKIELDQFEIQQIKFFLQDKTFTR